MNYLLRVMLPRLIRGIPAQLAQQQLTRPVKTVFTVRKNMLLVTGHMDQLLRKAAGPQQKLLVHLQD